jgi:hypothetical protein
MGEAGSGTLSLRTSSSLSPFLFLILFLFLLYLLALLFRVFTIIHLQQAMFLGYIVLQLICIYNLFCISHVKHVLYFHITTLQSMRAVPIMAAFAVP